MSRFSENAESSASIRAFLNQLAHELASPLASLRSQIDFLEAIVLGGRHVRDPAEQFAYLREQADFIHYIVRDLQIQFGKGETIRASYDFSRRVDLRPMIERVKKLLLPSARQDRQVDILSGTTKLPQLHVDLRRMEQVIFNLLENAIKYSRIGGGDIFVGYDLVEVTPEHAKTQRWHRLSVKNWGVGVLDADEPVIFEEYRRGANIQHSPSGTGLGLAVAKKIVEAHGGLLYVLSRSNPTIFAVDLPEALSWRPPDDPNSTD